MQIKESNVTILLLSILFASLVFKSNEVLIPENYISIIDDNEIPIFNSQYLSNNNPIDNPNIEVDTTGHIISDKGSYVGKKWMKRYQSGIRFEFYPPR